VIVLDRATTEVTHFVRRMTGSSQAFLVGADDGNFYVAKFPGTTKGPHVLVNECAGHAVYRSLGLSVPDWKAVSVSSRMIEDNASYWDPSGRGDVSLPRPGVCFCSQFFAAAPARVFELLPVCRFSRLLNTEDFWLAWTADVLAMHAASRHAVFVEEADQQLRAFFVDHSSMFGGYDGTGTPNPSTSQYMDRRIYASRKAGLSSRLLRRLRRIDIDALWSCIQSVPDEWKTLSALQAVSSGLDRLSDIDLGQAVCEELMSAVDELSGESKRPLIDQHPNEGAVVHAMGQR